MDRHDTLLATIDKSRAEVYTKQKNRPDRMEYFDRMLSDIDGVRVKELIEHKQKGGKVVGVSCLFVPEEIISAGGGMVVRLEGGSQLPITEAETILPSDICPMIKSTFGLKLSKTSPYYEVVDFLAGETSCDGKKKMWEIFNNYIPTYVVELPQKKTQRDRELWLRELYDLKEKMEVESGKKITSQDLYRSITIFNAKRKAMARLQLLRRKNPPPISGNDANLVFQISCFDDPERFTAKVNELCDELEMRVKDGEETVSADMPRIMISGCPMALPNWKVHHLIETGGAVVVGEDTCLGARYFMEPVVQPEDPTIMAKQMTAIADRYLNVACPCFTPGYCSVLQMTDLVENCKPDGVVYYVLQFCHGFNIEYYKMEKRLKELNIPVLKIQSDYAEEDIGQLRTRIEAFIERISRKR
jgi:benzoyl-CoA reductase/2-hydroxyglutaryl-CoA dehydratase subunit BcrC/BadD/HgdB